MYRRVVLTSPTQTSGNLTILYHVRGAVLLAQYRRGLSGYDSTIGEVQPSTAVVFDDAVRLKTSASLAANRTFEFVLDVFENQPVEESVEEVSTVGIGIEVYNADGVLVCSKPHANG